MRHTRNSEVLTENSPNRGREQARRGMVDVLQRNNGLSLRTRQDRPSYRDPDSSDLDEFEESVPPKSRKAQQQAAEISSRPSRSSSRPYATRLTEYEETSRPKSEGHSHSRRSTAHGSDSLSYAVPSRRSSRRSAVEDADDDDEETQRYPRRHSSRHISAVGHMLGHEDEEDPSSRYTRRSSVRAASLQQEQPEEDDEEDEEEDEDREQKKYTFRDRAQHKRETLNVSHLGGDGQSYLKSTKSHRQRERDCAQQGHSIYREPPRVYLGGKISTSGRDKRRSGHRHGHRRHHKRRHFDSSSDSSSGSSSESGHDRGRRRKRRRGYGGTAGEDLQFREHEEERLRREMASIMPMSLGRGGGVGGGGGGMGGSVMDKASRRDIARADVTPIAVDPSVGFASVGGLDRHVQSLKEMVVLPLLYPDIFHRFDTQPPRGVLFVGPPGTGKTLTARALANSLCAGGAIGGSGGGAVGGRKVSFFMRKGADCLSKWVGEGERQLRLLFEQAKLYEPSIIFFDEIDGLAPVRSIKQDQIHASIVSTLLALMDGLDSRGQVVVIGATNRPDAIDPALRRPGRFDRELLFPLPDISARRAILDIHTASWQPPLEEDLKQWIVESSGGYCGADMKALCSEAAIISLRRAYPQVYSSNVRLNVDPSTLVLTRGDFAAAFNKVIPASRRSAGTPARALEGLAAPLLAKYVDEAYRKACEVFAPADKDIAASVQKEGGDLMQGSSQEEWIAALTDVENSTGCSVADSSTPVKTCSSLWDPSSITSRPRVMIRGPRGMAHADVAAALLQKLESFPVFNIDLSSLLADGAYFSPEQALVSRILEARRAAPCVIYLPDVIGWWRSATDSLRTILMVQLDSIPVNLAVLWVSSLILEPGRSEQQNDTGAASNSACVGNISNDSVKIDSLGMRAEGTCPSEGKDTSVINFDEKLLQVIHFLGGGECNSKMITGDEASYGLLTRSYASVIDLCVPTYIERLDFFSKFFESLSKLPHTLYSAQKTLYKSHNQVLHMAEEVAATTEEGGKGQYGVRSAALALADINEERDKNFMREQRVFFRAALSELLKEKRFQSLWRPVDPEQVPDYYDVITAPMDLETMRSKVDADLYPTYKYFLYDIEQIIFNAKEYNPLNSKDSRGRSIVSAAHNMLDVVETHAYGFKQRMEYDVFQRCEEVCLRRGMERWRLEPNLEHRHVMPEENKIYYAAVLRVHEDVKRELREEEDCSGLQTRAEVRVGSLSSTPATKVVGGESTVNTDVAPVAAPEQLNERELRRLSRERAAQAARGELELAVDAVRLSTVLDDTRDRGVAVEAEVEGPSEQAEKAPLVSPVLAPDFDESPLAVSLLQVVAVAAQMETDGTFCKLTTQAVEATEAWTISQLLSLYSGLNRSSRKFQSTYDWECTIQEIIQTINQL